MRIKKEEKPYVETLCKWAQRGRREYILPTTKYLLGGAAERMEERTRELSSAMTSMGISVEEAAEAMRARCEQLQEERQWCPYSRVLLDRRDLESTKRVCQRNNLAVVSPECAHPKYKACGGFKREREKRESDTETWWGKRRDIERR